MKANELEEKKHCPGRSEQDADLELQREKELSAHAKNDHDELWNAIGRLRYKVEQNESYLKFLAEGKLGQVMATAFSKAVVEPIILMSELKKKITELESQNKTLEERIKTIEVAHYD